MEVIITIVAFICIYLLYKVCNLIEKRSNEKVTNKLISDLSNLGEWSYQRYAKFYGNVVLPDADYAKKISIITDYILNKNETDIEKIAEASGCNYNECILKIDYLKNKRIIGNLYIDVQNGIVNKCSDEDEKLLKKYQYHIYKAHNQIRDIAISLPNTESRNLKDAEEQVFKELCYLDDKHLLNGISINKIDRKIIYYTIEKHKKEKDYITINCPNCGAINDVDRHGKTRCDYCDTIIEHKEDKNMI